MPANIVLVGNPGSVRISQTVQSLAATGLAEPRVVAYKDLLEQRVSLSSLVSKNAVVKIDSPGKDFAVEKLILSLGARSSTALDSFLTESQLSVLDFERGRILQPLQWYAGFCSLMEMIGKDLAASASHRLMNSPQDIVLMFDKLATYEHLRHDPSIPQPRTFGQVGSAEEFLQCLRSNDLHRALLKLRHGSSASGMVAFRTSKHGCQAISTTQLERNGSEIRLYNSRKLQIYNDEKDVFDLIDELTKFGAIVQEWLPKARLGSKHFDLRVLVVGGKSAHVVVRKTGGVFTNLHLLNERAAAQEARLLMGEDAWLSAMSTCEKVMERFASSHYAGIDLLIPPRYDRHRVLEVNAFGDQLTGVTFENQDTYALEFGSFK